MTQGPKGFDYELLDHHAGRIAAELHNGVTLSAGVQRDWVGSDYQTLYPVAAEPEPADSRESWETVKQKMESHIRVQERQARRKREREARKQP